MIHTTNSIVDLPEFREQERVFQDRTHAGNVLAEMLETFRSKDGLILAIPAGGVPVGVEVARRLDLAFDVAVVSKITLPWNTEAGYGAVAFDGTLRLNKNLVQRVNLTKEDIQKGIEKTTVKVTRRAEKLRGRDPFPDLSKRSVILVDDGLASGFTMMVAVEALRKCGADQIVVAVPTGHRRSVKAIAEKVEVIYCPNIRGGLSFAVASAYQYWSDVSEEAVVRTLKKFRTEKSAHR